MGKKNAKKLNSIMKDFLKQACGLLYYDAEKEDYFPKKISLFKHDEFIALTPSYEYSISNDKKVIIGYNFNQLDDVTLTTFRKYWSEKYPMIRGFSQITLSLLHELGHWEMHDEVRKYYSWEDREAVMKEIGEALKAKQISLAEANIKYFGTFDEACATEWAMNWLSQPENRKIAKKFEKKFFKYYKGS